MQRDLPLTRPIVERMKRIEGWLSEPEAELLIAAVARALSEIPAASAVVEVGSYAGRSTVVLGTTVKAVRRDARVFAIDPHEGELSVLGASAPIRRAPTRKAFEDAVASAGLEHVVTTIPRHSWEVEWETPIAFLFIDGLHDYPNVSRDFSHFEPWLVSGAYVAFHDYCEGWPGGDGLRADPACRSWLRAHGAC